MNDCGGGGAKRRCGVTVKLASISGLVDYTIVDRIVEEISYGWYSEGCGITG